MATETKKDLLPTPETKPGCSGKFNPYKEVVIMGVSFMLIYCCYGSVVGLQSTINIKGGLGTTSLMVISIISAVSSLTLVPFIIDFLGAKTALMIGEAGSVLFITANFYARWYTLMPAAVIDGFVDGAIWPGSGMYITWLGTKAFRRFKNRHPDKEITKESFLSRYFGYFYTFMFCGDLLTSGLTTLSLMAFTNQGPPAEMSSNQTQPELETMPVNESDAMEQSMFGDISQCGANECQSNFMSANLTDEDLEMYIPSKNSLYLLCGLGMAFGLTAIAIQFFCLPPAPSRYEQERKAKKALKLEYNGATDRHETKLDDGKEENDEENDDNKVANVRKEMRMLLRHFVSPLNLLVIPFLFYCGLYIGFQLTEYPRAFVSCVNGVEQVGIAYVVLSVSGVSTSVLCSQLIPKIGLRRFLIIVFFVHLTIYLVCRFWVPTVDTKWASYVIAVIIGIGGSSIFNTMPLVTNRFFEDSLAAAFGTQNCFMAFGYAFSTGWSLGVCVYAKIYLLLGFLILAFVCLIGAELLRDRKLKQKKEEEEKNDIA
ncbi:protein unc-93 homolog A-like [Clavelina lepadiformis]|uniref:protein unc-93 homolog A-like n=1 Tax=Clavelina lepadiformis TaxID=159417 RepID=UPI0040417F8B